MLSAVWKQRTGGGVTHGKEEILPNHMGYPVHATGLQQQCKPVAEDKDAGEDKVKGDNVEMLYK